MAHAQRKGNDIPGSTNLPHRIDEILSVQLARDNNGGWSIDDTLRTFQKNDDEAKVMK